MVRKPSAFVLAAVLAVLLVACGGDDDEEGTPDTPEVTTATTEAVAAGPAEFCPVLEEIGRLFETIPDPGGSSPETLDAFVEVSNQILALRDEALAAAPDDLDDEVTVFFGAVEEVANDENPTAASINATYESPEQHAATTVLTEYCTPSSGGGGSVTTTTG